MYIIMLLSESHPLLPRISGDILVMHTIKHANSLHLSGRSPHHYVLARLKLIELIIWQLSVNGFCACMYELSTLPRVACTTCA